MQKITPIKPRKPPRKPKIPPEKQNKYQRILRNSTRKTEKQMEY